MNRYIVLLTLLGMLFTLPSVAQRRALDNDGKSQLSFTVTEHDFGDVQERGGKVSYDYIFTNTGDCPLVITRAITSCRCVGIEYNKRPIPPGGQGVISLTYNPRKQHGVFRKAIQVFSNAPEGVHIIIAKGVVKDDW